MASDKQDKVLNVPTLRFPGFTGEWRKDRIRNLFTINVVGDIDKKEVSDIQSAKHPYPVIANALTNDGIYGYTSGYKDDAPNITVTGRGDVGCAKYRNYPLYPIVRLLVLHSNGNIDCRFGEHAINRIKKYEESTGVPQLTAPQLGAYSICYPCLNEQSKIGDFLCLLEERIITQIRIIAQLQSLMTGLNNYLMDNPSWEKVWVGDFMDFYSTNSLSWEQLDYNQGEVKNLHYGLIHSGLPTLIDCRTSALPNIKNEFLPKQYTLCEDGDVAFADASEDTNEVGKAVEICDCTEQSVVCGLHTIHGRDKANATIVGFKGFAFNAKYFHDQLRRISQGSKIYSISTDNVKSCYLRIPSKSEQKQVVHLLSAYLQKIDIAEQELKAYQVQKQYLLKAMFV